MQRKTMRKPPASEWEPAREFPALRLEMERRLCPAYDDTGIARFPVAAPGEMGVRVVDDFCEEHIQ